MKLIAPMMLILLTSCSELFFLSSVGGIAVSQSPAVKAYNGVDMITIMHTDKGIKQHAYEKIKDINEPKN
jgi:hypothetical protein|tara:strand:- start:103 stop:312 length:210 start_codon:yes stop_codon:yes gene_type:complete